MDNQLALLTLCGSIIALVFAASRAQKVLRFPEGNDRMRKISASIHHGAMAYLRRQYKILIAFFVGMFVILFIMAALGLLTWFVPFAFVTGGFFSGLSGFVGMLTDSRSFLSYTRHEYFRRVLCALVGGWVENGEYPADMKSLESIVKGISYNNAVQYFGFDLDVVK